MPRFASVFVCASTLLAVLATSINTSSVQAAEAVAPQEKIALFNGQDLTHWYTWLKDTKYEDPRKVFTVHDGMIHISGDGLGCITTKEAYRDYHLIVEFKFGERTWAPRENKTKDSGVLIHSFGEDGAHSGIWARSIEAQVIEGGCGDFIVVAGTTPDPNQKLSITAEVRQDRDKENVWHKGGEKKVFARGRVNWFGRDEDWKDVKGFRGKNDVESPSGEWTRMDVICDGDKVTNIVNGVVVNQAFDVTPSAGKIQIQTELAECYFRRVELWPIGKAPAFEKK
ncbi:MAG: DUF1080 domain-containing protein [Pirellula sp.]|nr:DUF1080 domain-containing protein [Pirellula sp.]